MFFRAGPKAGKKEPPNIDEETLDSWRKYVHL